MKTIIATGNAPKAVGPYSQATVCGDLIFTSGQLPIDPLTGKVPEGVEAQAHQAIRNLKAVLEEGGSSLANVLKTTVFLKDIADFAAINAIYAEYFPEPYPGRSCYQVAALPAGALFEIEAIAVKD